MAEDRGINPIEGCSGWFLDDEAECSDLENDLEKLFDEETSETELSDFLDDGETEQGNSRELLHQQESAECEEQVQYLKRKYFSPKAVQQLSPRLQAISLSPQQKTKKRLFVEQDSGVELSGLELSVTNEAEDVAPEVEVPAALPVVQGEGGGATATELIKDLLKSSNARAKLLNKVKEYFGVGFYELTRQYKSNKTCCKDWVLAIYGARDELLEACKQLLQQYCSYIWIYINGIMSLFLLCFNSVKSRDTVCKLISSMLDVQTVQILSEPPKLRSMVSALFWYKYSMDKSVYAFGTYPDWIVSQTMISHQFGDTAQFDLSQMVQWAFDNNLMEESDIAYKYAKLADTDSNARAWLAHNSQAKFVRECAAMVRHYKRGEMRDMSISEWIYHVMQSVEGEGHWSDIVKFIRFQGINFILFLDAFKHFIQGTPKKQCLLIYGPPDCGKTMFTMSLLRFMKGRVISFANSKSHFWLQPLGECKMGLLDDATEPCWTYIDLYLRNGIDGNLVSIDCKHKAPMQIKFPPLLITSNMNIISEERFRYLHSRIQGFEFKNKFPFNADGTPQFALTDQSWKSFFTRLWKQLELSDQEDEGEEEEQNGGTQRSFQCTTREIAGHL